MKKNILLLILIISIASGLSYGESSSSLTKNKGLSVGYTFSLPFPIGLCCHFWTGKLSSMEITFFALQEKTSTTETLYGNYGIKLYKHFGSGPFERYYCGIGFGQLFSNIDDEDIPLSLGVSLFIGWESYQKIEDIERRSTTAFDFGISVFTNPPLVYPHYSFSYRFYL